MSAVSASRYALSPIASYIRDVNETGLVTAQEERELADRVQDGDMEARDELIRANLRLVIRIAREFVNRGISLEDLIQEGTLGLIRAIEGFEPERGLRLSTYAKFWIVQSMQNVVRTSPHAVRIPQYAAELVAKWRRTTATIAQETGEMPTDETVATQLGISGLKLKVIKEAMRIHQGLAVAKTGEAAPLLDIVDAAPEPHHAVLQSDDLQHVLERIDKLDPREAMVLRLRFGLNGEEPISLSEIGGRLNLTRKRVRQLEAKALASLRDAVA